MKTNSGSFVKALAAAGAVAVLAVSGSPVQALDTFSTTINKTGAKTRALGAVKGDDLRKLAQQKIAYVDVKVTLDDKSRLAVLSSEEQDPSRTNVECRAGGYGPLPMYEGLEYYIQTEDSAGNRVALSVYPGSRTVNPDNDVSCTSDNSSSAVIRIVGIYKVSARPEGKNLRLDLRPLTRASLTPDDIKKLP